MPDPKPPAVQLSAAERQELLGLMRAHKTPQHHSCRAHLILLLADGHTAPEVAHSLGTSWRTVRLWRRHCLARPERTVAERLQDATRPGAPTTFSAEQWCQIIALACEPPEASKVLSTASHGLEGELHATTRPRSLSLCQCCMPPVSAYQSRQCGHPEGLGP